MLNVKTFFKELNDWALDSFKWITISPHGMKKKNCSDTMESSMNAELHCTGNGLNQEYYNLSEDDEEVSCFTEIDDFIKAAKLLEITDMLVSF